MDDDYSMKLKRPLLFTFENIQYRKCVFFLLNIQNIKPIYDQLLHYRFYHSTLYCIFFYQQAFYECPGQLPHIFSNSYFTIPASLLTLLRTSSYDEADPSTGTSIAIKILFIQPNFICVALENAISLYIQRKQFDYKTARCPFTSYRSQVRGKSPSILRGPDSQMEVLMAPLSPRYVSV